MEMHENSNIEKAIRMLRASRLEEAEALLSAVLVQDGLQPDALHGMSVIEFQRGRKAEAVELLARLIAAHPARNSAKYDLACMLIEQGRDDEAEILLSEVVSALPRHASAWYQLGFLYRAKRDYARAKVALEKSLSEIPHHSAAANELARLHRDEGHYEAALRTFEEAGARKEAGAGLFHAWWQFLSMSALSSRGRDVLALGVAAEPLDADLRIDFGQALEESGDRAGARREYLTALKLDRNRGAAIGSLLQLAAGQAEEELLITSEAILADPQAQYAAKALVGYGLGKVYQARKNYKDAFRVWNQANALRRAEAGCLDRVALSRQIKQTCVSFVPEEIGRLSQWGADDARPLLIVGMPRSGTTLVEQILAAHPDVEGLGELPDLPIVAERFCHLNHSTGEWPALEKIVDGSSVSEVAAHYRRIIDFRMSARAQVAVDKAPLNFFNVGLFSLMFPRGRVIWCRRDPRDVCLSIYSENFAPSQRYATDLADLAFYHRQHEVLMSHWLETVPERILEVSYESLVAEQEAQTRRILDFVGLNWNVRCLEFYRAERAVQTPSRWQVRQPMYSSSVARWRAYAPWLGPLLSEFGDGPRTIERSDA